MMSLASLLPPEFGLPAALLLCAVSFLTSALTAAIGLGGGVALIAVMATVMPPLAVVPLHGVVQLGSNFGRAVVQRRHVAWHIFVWFAAGSLLGALIGGRLAFALPGTALKAILGLFILYAVWGPKPKIAGGGGVVFALVGAVSTFLTMFVGATGPFAAAVLPRKQMHKAQVVGSHAANMSLQHLLKIGVFGMLGFAYGPWLPLLAAMVATGFLGTLVGSRLLDRLPERAFRIAFSAVLTVLAVKLLADAAGWP
jgi:uncharacterized membrane protein YfcA